MGAWLFMWGDKDLIQVLTAVQKVFHTLHTIQSEKKSYKLEGKLKKFTLNTMENTLIIKVVR